MKDKNKKIVLWIDYFDIERSRPVRRISRAFAVRNPDAKKIFRIANDMGLAPEMVESRHPSTPWKKSYRILVDKKIKKTELIKQIAERLKSM